MNNVLTVVSIVYVIQICQLIESNEYTILFLFHLQKQLTLIILRKIDLNSFIHQS